MSGVAGDDPHEVTTASVLRRDVPWETYLTARLISEPDLQLIRSYDKRGRARQEELLAEVGPAHVEAFLTVLRNVTKEDTVQYVLAVLDDMLTHDASRAKLFHAPLGKQPDRPRDPYTIFLRLLQRTDWFTQEKACRLLTAILGARPGKAVAEAPPGPMMNGAASSSVAASAPCAPPPQAESGAVQSVLVSFTGWLCSQLRRPSNPGRSVPAAVAALGGLLREAPARALFAKSGGVALLAPLLRAGAAGGPGAPSSQLLYEAGLAVWQLSFYQPAAAAMGQAGMLPGLVELTRTAAKEKVVRVALLALRNLLAAPGLELGPEMVDLGLPKVVQQRKLQNWEDEDIPAMLEELDEALAANIKLLSSWDKYKKEVLSGSLDWTPMHTSDAFWVENAPHFEERDFQVLRLLLKLLETSRESRTLAVAASDLGRFIAAHPHGRNIVADLRGKELAMRLMMHPDAEVQKQALLAVQKILLAKDKLAFLTTPAN
ncbi:hypothetical protein WJX81_007801 [Elliptochloris bilobata]|uniref:V-type proton ATPase subunit H n=1 Tax=Elliptochloris bilobata TaxID=381761 RepID=A0AAW1SJX2_9CHLO